jgi:hypothetical protein
VLSANAAWCGQCFAAVTAPAGGFVPAAATGGVVPTVTRTTRWQKTPTTFGPVGRLVATVALLIPLAVMVVGGFAVMFSWGGAAVYAAVIVPWGLRDIWREGRLPTR